MSVVGGGLAGVVAAISAAEQGVNVELFEARSALGGRAQSLTGDFHANLGPHVIYADGFSWKWLRERRLLPPSRDRPLVGFASTPVAACAVSRRAPA